MKSGGHLTTKIMTRTMCKTNLERKLIFWRGCQQYGKYSAHERNGALRSLTTKIMTRTVCAKRLKHMLRWGHLIKPFLFERCFHICKKLWPNQQAGLTVLHSAWGESCPHTDCSLLRSFSESRAAVANSADECWVGHCASDKAVAQPAGGLTVLHSAGGESWPHTDC